MLGIYLAGDTIQLINPTRHEVGLHFYFSWKEFWSRLHDQGNNVGPAPPVETH